MHTMHRAARYLAYNSISFLTTMPPSSAFSCYSALPAHGLELDRVLVLGGIWRFGDAVERASAGATARREALFAHDEFLEARRVYV